MNHYTMTKTFHRYVRAFFLFDGRLASDDKISSNINCRCAS